MVKRNKNYLLNLKSEYKKAFLGLIFIIGLIFVIRYFQMTKWGVIWTLFGVQVFFQTVKFINKRQKYDLKGLIKGFIHIVVLVHVFALITKYGGFWGDIFVIFLIALLIIVRRRKKLLAVKYHIETMIWGKPLKEYINKKQKIPKVEIVWKK